MITRHPTREARTDGWLIAAEGIDGSGKSTQVHLLEQWLRQGGLRVFKTEWNSSDVVKEITSKGKKKGTLTPTTFSLLHATDFDDRYERNILPLLHAGYWVLADRYVYTAYARDAVRGCHPAWIRRLYSFARRPDIVFYFQVPVDVAVNRILSGRPKLKYYEAGMDLNLSNDVFESYRIFQSRVTKEYESMVRPEGFVVVDGSLRIEEQQRLVRDKVSELMPKEVVSKTMGRTGLENRGPG
jgi:dTMP kinase